MAKQKLSDISFEDCFDDYKEDKKYDIEETPKKKSFDETSLGQILKAIKVTKNEQLLDDVEIRKDFTAFVILKFLSMTEEYCELVNMVNQVHGPMDKEMVFKLLVKLIPQGKVFDKYLSTKREQADEQVINIAKYYEIGHREARIYIQIMGDEWSEDVSSRLTNKVSSKKKSKRGKK